MREKLKNKLSETLGWVWRARQRVLSFYFPSMEIIWVNCSLVCRHQSVMSKERQLRTGRQGQFFNSKHVLHECLNRSMFRPRSTITNELVGHYTTACGLAIDHVLLCCGISTSNWPSVPIEWMAGIGPIQNPFHSSACIRMWHDLCMPLRRTRQSLFIKAMQ